jgi:hypothetical protein
MNDPAETHPAAGAVGNVGAAGDLGTNAAGAERPAAPPAAAPLILVPAATDAKPAFVAATAEAQIVAALINAGYPSEEAVPMAQAAIAELESRKAK